MAQDVALIEVSKGFVRVKMLRRIADVAEAETLQRQIASTAGTADVSSVLFDYRGVVGHDESVRNSMWSGPAPAVTVPTALLVDSELSYVRMNMTAVSKRVLIRAFLSEHEALAWLADPASRRPTREVKPI
ncbi:MAG: hypothetical protein U0168_19600 [Nannocystaceae bacterium]